VRPLRCQADAPPRQALPWLEGSVQGVTHVGIFTLTTAVALVMYLHAVFTDPGRRVCTPRAVQLESETDALRCSVPPTWVPDVEGAAFVEVKKKVRRLCRGCGVVLPPAWTRLGLTRAAVACASLRNAGRRATLLPEVQAP
jgi:hypothetical protein